MVCVCADSEMRNFYTKSVVPSKKTFNFGAALSEEWLIFYIWRFWNCSWYCLTKYSILHFFCDHWSRTKCKIQHFSSDQQSKHAAKWARYLSVTWVPTILGLYERMGKNPLSPIFYAASFTTAPGPPPYKFIICILHCWEGEMGSSHSEQVTTSSPSL